MMRLRALLSPGRLKLLAAPPALKLMTQRRLFCGTVTLATAIPPEATTTKSCDEASITPFYIKRKYKKMELSGSEVSSFNV
jgi:hypothetical protein